MDGDSVVGRLEDERGKRAKDDGLGPARAGFIDFIGGGCCTWGHFGRTKEGRRDERGLGDSDARLSGRRSVLAGERHEAEGGRERRTERGRTHAFGARGASIANGAADHEACSSHSDGMAMVRAHADRPENGMRLGPGAD